MTTTGIPSQKFQASSPLFILSLALEYSSGQNRTISALVVTERDLNQNKHVNRCEITAAQAPLRRGTDAAGACD